MTRLIWAVGVAVIAAGCSGEGGVSPTSTKAAAVTSAAAGTVADLPASGNGPVSGFSVTGNMPPNGCAPASSLPALVEFTFHHVPEGATFEIAYAFADTGDACPQAAIKDNLRTQNSHLRWVPATADPGDGTVRRLAWDRDAVKCTAQVDARMRLKDGTYYEPLPVGVIITRPKGGDCLPDEDHDDDHPPVTPTPHLPPPGVPTPHIPPSGPPAPACPTLESAKDSPDWERMPSGHKAWTKCANGTQTRQAMYCLDKKGCPELMRWQIEERACGGTN